MKGRYYVGGNSCGGVSVLIVICGILCIALAVSLWKTRKYYKMAYYDGLTGIYNRTYFEEEFENFFREKKNFALVMIDIDNFKIVNDTLGHAKGDQILIDLARKLEEYFEFSFRYGGDEFVVLEKDLKNLEEKLRTIQDVFSEVMFSFGISTLQEFSTKGQLFENADSRMYLQKKAHKTKAS